MLNKGTVMEAYRDWAVIMNDRCEFIKIRTKSILVPGENIEYPTKDIIPGRNFLTKNLSIAASFIICFITAAFIFQYMYLGRVYAYVGLEINPSLEIAVNSRNLVVGAEAFDKEGLELVQENNFSKTSMETTLKELLVQSMEHGYLHGDNPNVIGVSLSITDTNGSGEMITKIEETIREVLAEKNIGSAIFILRIDKQTREEAIKNNVSPIRYFLWTKAKEQDLSLPIEEVSLTNARDFNNACLLSDKVTYQSSQEESSASEVLTEESLPLGEPAGLDEERSVQQNSGLPPAGQAGMPQDNQNGKISEPGSPYQQPAGSGQVNQAVPGDNAPVEKQGGTTGSDGNRPVETGAEVTGQVSDSNNSCGSSSSGGSTSTGGSSSSSGGTSGGGSSSSSGSTSSSGGGGSTGRSGSGGR